MDFQSRVNEWWDPKLVLRECRLLARRLPDFNSWFYDDAPKSLLFKVLSPPECYCSWGGNHVGSDNAFGSVSNFVLDEHGNR